MGGVGAQEYALNCDQTVSLAHRYQESGFEDRLRLGQVRATRMEAKIAWWWEEVPALEVALGKGARNVDRLIPDSFDVHRPRRVSPRRVADNGDPGEQGAVHAGRLRASILRNR
jgi:hypothetical protein